jgi:competence protein ComEC
MTPLIRFGLAWMAGIALARWLDLPWFIIVLAGLPALGALWLYQQNPRARWWAVVIVAGLAGAFRFLFFQPTFDERDLAFYNDTPAPLKITGLVVDEPDVRDNYINLRLQAESLHINDTSRPVDGLLLVRAPRYPERFYGDRLTVSGNLETPPVLDDFSYNESLSAIDKTG